ncbi:MAG: pectinesterase family protein [Firmicutes bacterium]|nr:pectinesterase family protein [Bacillota bacterium]
MPQAIYVTPDDKLQAVFDRASVGATIHLSAGVYRQKVLLRTPGLTIVGQGAEKTILVYDDYARKRDEAGFEYLTFRSYTLAVCADGVRLENLAVVNDALTPESKGQEVALSVVADAFAMESCRLRSTQDTLFAGPLPPDLIERYRGFLPDALRRGGALRQRYGNCQIEGTVDFIFGCADARFDGCELRSLADARGIGYVAAPAHPAEQAEGFVFQSCRFTCADGVAPGSVYLARPWRDWGLCSFVNCSYGPHIAPLGFDKWNDTHRDRTARFRESPAVPGRVGWVNQR